MGVSVRYRPPPPPPRPACRRYYVGEGEGGAAPGGGDAGRVGGGSGSGGGGEDLGESALLLHASDVFHVEELQDPLVDGAAPPHAVSASGSSAGGGSEPPVAVVPRSAEETAAQLVSLGVEPVTFFRQRAAATSRCVVVVGNRFLFVLRCVALGCVVLHSVAQSLFCAPCCTTRVCHGVVLYHSCMPRRCVRVRASCASAVV